MTTSNWITLAGILVAIIAHAFATVWWASKVSSTLNNILLALVRIDTEFEKRDSQISKLSEKVDNQSQIISNHTAQLQHLNK